MLVSVYVIFFIPLTGTILKLSGERFTHCGNLRFTKRNLCGNLTETKVPRYNEIVYKTAFSLYSSLLSIRFFEIGRSNKVRHRFRHFSNGQFILLLIHHQCLQFWYRCIKKTSIYHIIGNPPPPQLPPQHTENGQSLRFTPIRKVDLRGWPLNSDTTFY